jgi:Fur family transcriptional regulator, iron response regulator
MDKEELPLAASPKTLERLRAAGLKPTRQRLALGALLLEGPPRHVTCEALYAEALAAGGDVSLATVYNTLHQFRDAGLITEVRLDSDRRWFDTNTEAHHHFFLEDSGALIDIPAAGVEVASVPPAPKGYAVDGVDVIVRLRPTKSV